MSADARRVTERVVEEIVKEHVSRLACDRIRFLSLSDFSTWEVDGIFIVRFAIDEGSDRQLGLEVAALPLLADRLPVAVPRVEFVATGPDGHRVMGYPKLPGVDGEHFRPTPDNRDGLVMQFAELLTGIRRLDPEEIGHDLPHWPGPNLDTALGRIGKYAPLIREYAPDLVTAEMESFFSGDVEVPTRPETRVVSHADLKGEHLLFDDTLGRLTSVIDWADLSLSDPAVDLGYLAIWLGPEFMNAVGREIGASPEMLERALFGIRAYMLIGVGATLAGEKKWPLDLARTQLAQVFPVAADERQN